MAESWDDSGGNEYDGSAHYTVELDELEPSTNMSGL
jgi:hypothetical protein